MSEKRTMFEEEIKCPYCKKHIDVKRIKETIIPAEKGEYEEKTIVKKSQQTRLK